VLTPEREWRRIAAWSYVAVAAQLLLTVPLAFALNIGKDDAYTLASTGQGAAYALHQAIFFEQNAPLYFVVMSLWRAIDGSAPFARLFSVLCAAATVLALPALLRRYFASARHGWLVAAAAFNPFLIWAALDIRLYALVILLSTLLLITFHDAFLAERRAPQALAAFAGTAIAGMYTQYYIGFLLAAMGLALARRRRRAALREYALMAAGVALAFAPMLPLLPGQLASFRGAFAAPGSPLASAQTLASILLGYLFPVDASTGAGWILLALLVGAVALGYLVLKSRSPLEGGVIVEVFVLSAAVFALVVYLAQERILYRHPALLFVPALVSVFALVTLLREPLRGRVTAALGVVLLMASATTLVGTYRPLAKTGDWARVARYLRSQAVQGQPIVVFEAEYAVPLAYYYRGPNPVVPVPVAVNFRTYDVASYVLRDGDQVSRALERVPGTHRTIWLVAGDRCRAQNIEYGCDVLERYVREHYRVLSTRAFYGSTVRLLAAR